MAKGKSTKKASVVPRPASEPVRTLIFDPGTHEPAVIGGFLTGPSGALHGLALVHAGEFGEPTPELWESMRGEFMNAFHKAECCVEGRTMVREEDGMIRMLAGRESLGRRCADALQKPRAVEAEARFIIRELREYAIMHGLAVMVAPPGVPRYTQEAPPAGILERASELASIGRRILAVPADFASIGSIEVAKATVAAGTPSPRTKPNATIGPPRTVPLTGARTAILSVVWSAEAGEGVDGKSLIARIEKRHGYKFGQNKLTGHIGKMRACGWDIPNHGSGYFLSEADRIAADALLGKVQSDRSRGKGRG